MPAVRVRISDKEKRELLKYGDLSHSLREGLELYLRQRKSEQLLDKLEALQAADRVWIPTSVDVKRIREDRNRR